MASQGLILQLLSAGWFDEMAVFHSILNGLSSSAR
jgi:hypothetical protein